MPEGTLLSTLSFTLRKKEILRGYSAFAEVFMNSVPFSENFLKSFLNYSGSELNIKNHHDKSPHYCLMAGFTVSKKKIRKANERNRVKRLLREAYRKNKHTLTNRYNRITDVKLVFTLSEKGLAIVKSGTGLNSNNLENDMIIILRNIDNYLMKKGYTN